MGTDVLATQGARASVTMIFAMLYRINSVPARKGLIFTSVLPIRASNGNYSDGNSDQFNEWRVAIVPFYWNSSFS